MPTLHVLQGPDKGRTYRTPDESAVIGRTSDQIHLSDHSASRRHAEIRPVNGSWVLVDLNSSNGTYLNGQRLVSPTALKHGDQIKVGSTVLVFTGKEEVEGFTGAQVIRDLVDVDMSSGSGESSILSVVDAGDSVILQPPETADAVIAWNVVYKIAETIGSITTVEGLLERITDILFEHLIADRLVLLMRDPQGGELTPQVVRSRTRDRGQRLKITTSQTIINHVLKTKEGVLCANAMTDDRFGGDSKQDSIHRLGLKSILCVPILVRDEIAGIFHLDSSMSRHTYTQEQLRLVVAIGRLAGMAIDNVRLQESRVQTERLAAAGETVAYLSHHIRNILQGMQGGADVVELGLKRRSIESVESGWSLIRRNLNRIYVLAMNMLTFSKDRQPRVELAQLNKIVEDVISLVQNKADEHKVMILTDLDEMPAIPLDPEGMHQVAHNIIINAIEAAPPQGGRVNISTKYQPAAACVCLSIGDNGPGILPEEKDRIFDPFHSSKGQAGTGLGLAAARKIVAELNGEIEVESAVGEGTIFHVRLPAVHVRLADADKTHAPG
ncbi:MAG: ATP-binding protein [Phycisphaerales bacterium]|nr:ATP-binding protein [Phycisphaerales bacterium]